MMKQTTLFKSIGMLLLLGVMMSCTKNYGIQYPEGTTDNNHPADTVDLVLDTSMFKVDKSQFNAARVFPGMVGIEEPRLKEYKVTLDLDYVQVISSDLRINVAPGGFISTGMYAPPGELITIKVPANTYGLAVQVGAHTENVGGFDPMLRPPIIYTRVQLFPGVNYVRNLYGGTIWINPERSLGRKVDLFFSGSVKSPDFVLGETTDAEWKAMIAKTQVPWFELRSKRMIFTLPVNKLAKFPIESPTALMTAWDQEILKSYWEWYGLSETTTDLRNRNPTLPWRIVHELQLAPGVAQHSGYPVMALANDNYFKQAVTLSQVIGANWGTYHELGHNMQMTSTWSWPDLGEVSCNFFSLKITNRNGYKHSNIYRAMPETIAFASIANTDDKKLFTSASGDARMGMFIQIFERYGYDFMTYLCTQARMARFGANNDQDKKDFFYERLSEWTKKDMKPFMTQWGLYPSSVSKNKIAAQFPLLTEQVWLFDPSK
ncbi:M60 family metallopeptidase [Pedobacter hiemivivus]|nr:M60 family metallopeptidase [Pedobacter hiemivivus]